MPISVPVPILIAILMTLHCGSQAIQDSVMEGRMRGVTFGLGSIMLFPQQKHTAYTSSESAAQMTTVKLHQLETSSWLWGRQARKLINESVGTFLSLQTAVAEAEPDRRNAVLVKKCREYRSIIQACQQETENLQPGDEAEEGGTDPSAHDDFTALQDILYKMELILSLVELLFIDTMSEGHLLNQLVKWIQQHFPQHERKKSLVLQSDRPHLHPDYWNVVYGSVLQGRLEDARLMLSNHPSADTDPFLSIDELLRKMPVFQVYGGVSVGDFEARWQHWQSECERRLEEGFFAGSHHLRDICKILCGDLEAISKHMNLMDTWYHLMVSTLLFSKPVIKLFHLSTASQDAIVRMQDHQVITALDHVLLAAMEADMYQVVKECQQVMDNPWFTTHLTDLLYHTVHHKGKQQVMPPLRECLLLDYAELLAGHTSLWQVGLLYLDHCGPRGMAMAQEVLQRHPITSDTCAQKIVQMASDRDFDGVVVSVCRVMGRQALSQGRLGAAIWWGVRSKDAAFTSHLAHQILHKYISDGQFESSALLDNLGPAMLLSDALTFLGKYREFHVMYQEGRYEEAAALLVSLISSRLAPEYFWPVLLLDALPLLKAKEPVISSEQTYELMYILDTLTNTARDKDHTESEAVHTSFLDKEKDIRLALSHNLAQAIIHEGTVEA
ncbi:Nuclear pore complex protein Nup85 [Chionoecetes opilio]|uniref:Nuclear pore complex protein Nup85 n=1 Tax=Chionoecetes opilio TaxID=41210 RepID=A0A8J4YCE5_CHIOP|nr:Nuclear pore complex protein Nup85 [Chionoecetes opilio]